MLFGPHWKVKLALLWQEILATLTLSTSSVTPKFPHPNSQCYMHIYRLVGGPVRRSQERKFIRNQMAGFKKSGSAVDATSRGVVDRRKRICPLPLLAVANWSKNLNMGVCGTMENLCFWVPGDW